MYELKNGRAVFKFNNGYKIEIKVNISNPDTGCIYRQEPISCTTADVSIYFNSDDVTQDFLDNGILKYKQRVTTSVFFKVANIIKTLPPKSIQK